MGCAWGSIVAVIEIRPVPTQEKSLAASSPSILFNQLYNTSNLLLVLNNRAFKFDLTAPLQRSCLGTCTSCHEPSYASIPVVRNNGVAANLVGRSLLDPTSPRSTVQAT